MDTISKMHFPSIQALQTPQMLQGIQEIQMLRDNFVLDHQQEELFQILQQIMCASCARTSLL
jgi:hypothetical protein